MKILETNRLILRHFEPDDLAALMAFYCEPQVRQYIPDAPQTDAETQAELAWHQHGHPQHPELGLWATIHKANRQFIGRCGLLPWTIDGQAEVEVAYALAPAYWGQGLATEAAQGISDYAFAQLGLSRLVCLIDPDNLASIRVAGKIGMEFEKEGQDEMGSFLLYTQWKKR